MKYIGKIKNVKNDQLYPRPHRVKAMRVVPGDLLSVHREERVTDLQITEAVSYFIFFLLALYNHRKSASLNGDRYDIY